MTRHELSTKSESAPTPAPTTIVRAVGVIAEMAARYGMDRDAFERTLRATVVPAETSKEQFAAFLLVAKEYGLNPVIKQIYAFPAKGGGIQPIVSIDGWIHMAINHPQFDGMEFDDILENGSLVAITCRMFRKDRTRAVEVTEYMSECKRDTDTWKKYPARMLRHKATIQCARYAFGFSGIVDPDEYDRIKDANHAPDVCERPALRDQVQRKSDKPEESTVIEGEAKHITDVSGDAAAPTLETLLQQLMEASTPDDIDLASGLAKEHLKGAGLKAFEGAAKNKAAEIQEQQA